MIVTTDSHGAWFTAKCVLLIHMHYNRDRGGEEIKYVIWIRLQAFSEGQYVAEIVTDIVELIFSFPFSLYQYIPLSWYTYLRRICLRLLIIRFDLFEVSCALLIIRWFWFLLCVGLLPYNTLLFRRSVPFNLSPVLTLFSYGFAEDLKDIDIACAYRLLIRLFKERLFIFVAVLPTFSTVIILVLNFRVILPSWRTKAQKSDIMSTSKCYADADSWRITVALQPWIFRDYAAHQRFMLALMHRFWYWYAEATAMVIRVPLGPYAYGNVLAAVRYSRVLDEMCSEEPPISLVYLNTRAWHGVPWCFF